MSGFKKYDNIEMKRRKTVETENVDFLFDSSIPLWEVDLLPIILSYFRIEEITIFRLVSKSIKNIVENCLVFPQYPPDGFRLLHSTYLEEYKKCKRLRMLLHTFKFRKITFTSTMEVFNEAAMEKQKDTVDKISIQLFEIGDGKLVQWDNVMVKREELLFENMVKYVKQLGKVELIKFSCNFSSDFRLLASCEHVSRVHFVGLSSFYASNVFYETFKRILSYKKFETVLFGGIDIDWMKFLPYVNSNEVIFKEIKWVDDMKQICNAVKINPHCKSFGAIDISVDFFRWYPYLVDCLRHNKNINEKITLIGICRQQDSHYLNMKNNNDNLSDFLEEFKNRFSKEVRLCRNIVTVEIITQAFEEIGGEFRLYMTNMNLRDLFLGLRSEDEIQAKMDLVNSVALKFYKKRKEIGKSLMVSFITISMREIDEAIDSFYRNKVDSQKMSVSFNTSLYSLLYKIEIISRRYKYAKITEHVLNGKDVKDVLLENPVDILKKSIEDKLPMENFRKIEDVLKRLNMN